MAFADFEYPEVQQSLGLNLAEAELVAGVAPAALSTEFVERMHEDGKMALAVNTEKARSEFIIAPVLSELRRRFRSSFGLFSGVEFDVDASRGLNGYSDFILTRSPLQSVLTTPVVAIDEAKNDNLRSGYGQCIAAMVAAREYNLQSEPPVPVVHGVVTTGSTWKFLRLEGANLSLDVEEYYIAESVANHGHFRTHLEYVGTCDNTIVVGVRSVVGPGPNATWTDCVAGSKTIVWRVKSL